MTNTGIELKVTQNGKLAFIAYDGESDVSFIMSHEQAKLFRDRFQSALSHIDHTQDNANEE